MESRVDALCDTAPQFVERAPDEIHFGLQLRQPLKLHVLIVAKIVQDFAALVEQRDGPIEFRASDVDPAGGRDPSDRTDAPRFCLLRHEELSRHCSLSNGFVSTPGIRTTPQRELEN
jgi:hypothetical protein